MTNRVTSSITMELEQLADETYKAFNKKLLPTVPADAIVGVRMPALRKFAKKLSNDPMHEAFLRDLPHVLLEQNTLHALLIAQIKDYEIAIDYTERFLPYIDNWATCDSFFPPCFRRHPDELYERICRWIRSDHTYSVRFAIVTLLRMYLDEQFDPKVLAMVASVQRDDYYVNMAIAWFFCEALIKRYDVAVAYLEQRRMNRWIHQKTIQKAVESRRVDASRQRYLRSLR